MAIVTSTILVFSNASIAVEAGDVITDMGDNERAGYMTGMADMLVYLEYAKGNNERGQCIYDWFYKDEGTIEKLGDYFAKYDSKPPEGIMVILSKRACPES